MHDRPIFTYQTRLALTPEQTAALDAWAVLYGKVERSLFAAMKSGESLRSLKRAFLPRFGISARQFNAIAIGLKGKIASIKERRPGLIAEAESRIRKAEKVIAKLAQKAPHTNQLHQKKRRLALMKARLKALQSDHAAGKVRLCFGGKGLFRAQFHLKENGYVDHAEWKAAWQRARSNQFFLIGSQDETAGNQSCQAEVASDGRLRLRLRLPDALKAQGKYLTIENVGFAYGHEQIVSALATSRRVHSQTKNGKPNVKRIGTALSYRFVRDDKGWRVFVSVEAAAVPQVTCRALGAIGVDVNADHLAVAETDRFGNLVAVRRIDAITYGKTRNQAKAALESAAIAVATQARPAGKPIVIEGLDFQKKKAELEATDPRQARLISSFAYCKILSSIKAAAFRHGVEVIEVNPAYTSVIGAVNFAHRGGISVHQGAALAIARRGLGLSERPTVREAVVPTRNGGHVTFALPARNRAKHVWSFWADVRARLRAAHAAQVRLGTPTPRIPQTQSVCAHRTLPVGFRHANRSQHRSGSVLEDVPF
jgi:IS605 OrfB family transposase